MAGVVHTPDADFNGADQFTYAAKDLDGNFSNIATVDITVNPVNDPPVAVDDQAITDQDTPVNIDVLANDTDIDGGPLTVTAFDNPSAQGGTVSCTAAGICTYTPPAGFSSPPDDSFTYTVSDGALTDIGTVTITVNPQLAETITVIRTLFRANRNEWVINGTTNVTTPHDMTVRLERTGQVIGTSPVDALGNWRVRDRNSPVTPQTGDTIAVESSLGAILSGVPVTIR